MSWRGYPVFGGVLVTLALTMLAPAGVAASLGDWGVATNFLYSAVVTAIIGGLQMIAMFRRLENGGAVGEFAVLIAILTLAPLAAAIPVAATMPFLSFGTAYFEMVSMITTTGASVFDRLNEIHPAIVLWRGIVAWFGGLVALIMAYALLAPRSLGGFEVRDNGGRAAAIGRLTGDPVWAGGQPSEAAGERLGAAFKSVFPLYLTLTVVLTFLLLAVGHEPLSALVLAGGVMSTTGVSAGQGAPFAASGLLGEMAVFAFLLLAATRHTYGGPSQRPLRFKGLDQDPEIRILAFAVIGITTLLYLRHWVGVFELQDKDADLLDSLRPLWGALFTTLSFATTTGYISVDWDSARTWSGLDNPSMIFFGLAIMGGGIATTAGGVKLLRAYALFKHGERELERLMRPSSVLSADARKRGLRREGAQIAWVFVMLFLVALAVVFLALSLTGLGFEPSLSAGVAALSNTGPLFPVTTGLSWATAVTPEGRAVLDIAMVLGRVEILALIAMLNTDNWRR